MTSVPHRAVNRHRLPGMLGNKGLLVSNEIFPQRAKILSQNIERLGVPNAVVCNETPENMAKFFPCFFDKIVVDAPCSGEGMFRKDETAIKEWTPENVTLCAERQKSILAEAEKMLKPGGVLVYSTCTFAPAEDEEILLWFLRTYLIFMSKIITTYSVLIFLTEIPILYLTK